MLEESASPRVGISPEGLGLGRPDIHAEYFAAAVAVDANRDDHRRRDDAPTLAHLHVSGVDPQIGPIAFNWALRWFIRSGLRSPRAAPVSPSTSSSIKRWAVKPIISRNRSASELFSKSVRRV
jgi:hypothetical protein